MSTRLRIFRILPIRQAALHMVLSQKVLLFQSFERVSWHISCLGSDRAVVLMHRRSDC